jgi:hypothetical protein
LLFLLDAIEPPSEEEVIKKENEGAGQEDV